MNNAEETLSSLAFPHRALQTKGPVRSPVRAAQLAAFSAFDRRFHHVEKTLQKSRRHSKLSTLPPLLVASLRSPMRWRWTSSHVRKARLPRPGFSAHLCYSKLSQRKDRRLVSCSEAGASLCAAQEKKEGRRTHQLKYSHDHRSTRSSPTHETNLTVIGSSVP